MHWLYEKLFGIDPAPWAEGGRVSVEWLNMPAGDGRLALLVAIGIGVWVVWWLYRKEGRGLSVPMRVAFTSIRTMIVLCVLAMLMEPVLVFTVTQKTPSNLLVLVDRSQSMGLSDAYASDAEAQRIAAALKVEDGANGVRTSTRLSLAKRALDGGLRDTLEAHGDRVVRVHTFDGQLNGDDAAAGWDKLDTTGRATGIGTALRQLLVGYRAQPVAGVLLITDGQSNTGETPLKVAEFARDESAPVVVLATGTEAGPRNVKITSVEHSPTVFVRDTNKLRVLLESRGMKQMPATVQLEVRRDGGPWQELGREQVTLAEAGQVQEVPFEFSEEKPTKLEFRVSVEASGTEQTHDDNVATAEVRVIRQKIRVLFIAGATFPEVQFLRNAMLRDRGVSMSSWLQTAEPNYHHMGDNPIRRLPNTQEELNDYDCVVMYDPDPSKWPPQFSDMLTHFVTKAGGGLVLISGERMTKDLFDRPNDPRNGWVKTLPVVREPGLFSSEVFVGLGADSAWKLQITPEGVADPIFHFVDDPAKNREVLASLPGMYWHFPVTRAKPGATVLARHGSPLMANQFGQHVLLATQLVGPGRTFFVGFDSTYRWRYLDENYFDGFWARLVDRAGRNKQLGGVYPFTLSTDRATYEPGSQVTLKATFVDPADQDAGLVVMHGEVEVGDNPPTPVALTPTGEPGVFATTFTASQAGPHFIRVWPGEVDPSGVVTAATTQVAVELPNLEYERPGLDRGTLDAVARASGGEVFTLAQLNDIPGAFKTGRVDRVLQDRQEVWDAPLLFWSILLLLTAEWVLRKRSRLV
ncbi:MAG: VWA domain-containing protein [Phycisphaera sp.]|nr:VWA domain-containing protein [Phycisphaera sp.]